jgi:hypothetical protein
MLAKFFRLLIEKKNLFLIIGVFFSFILEAFLRNKIKNLSFVISKLTRFLGLIF